MALDISFHEFLLQINGIMESQGIMNLDVLLTILRMDIFICHKCGEHKNIIGHRWQRAEGVKVGWLLLVVGTSRVGYSFVGERKLHFLLQTACLGLFVLCTWKGFWQSCFYFNFTKLQNHNCVFQFSRHLCFVNLASWFLIYVLIILDFFYCQITWKNLTCTLTCSFFFYKHLYYKKVYNYNRL